MSQHTVDTNKLTLDSLRTNVTYLQTTMLYHRKQLTDLFNTNTNLSKQIETVATDLQRQMEHLRTNI